MGNIRRQEISERFPGIQAVSYVERIHAENLDAHIEEIRAQGFTDYKVTPEDGRDEYYPVVYIEPFDGVNQRALGYDISSEPIRMEALERARDSNESTLTGKVVLVQESDVDVQSGFLMVLPIYEKGNSYDTVDERRSSLQGFVTAPFRMNDLMQGILGSTLRDITFCIYDDSQKDENIMFSFDSVHPRSDNPTLNQMAKTSTISFGGRSWVVAFNAFSSIYSFTETLLPFLVVIIGVSLSFVLYVVLYRDNRLKEDLKALTLTADQISKGNLRVAVESVLITSRRNIALLAKELENMRIQVLANVNRLTELNRQLEANYKMQKEFVNIAAHELRGPIVPILLTSSSVIMKSDTTDQEKPAQYVTLPREEMELINRNAKRLKILSDDILDVTRIESNSLRLSKEWFNLNEIILSCAKDFEEEAASRQLKLICKSKDIKISADKGRLTQVISNLLANSLKFTMEGKIVIAVVPNIAESKVSVHITDTGKGIDKEMLQRLFTKFATKSDKGFGLGLYISKNIVEAHGGTIWAENNADGKGATFAFSLPLSVNEEMKSD